MIDFFLKNYTWIFSGIGVVIITIIFGWISKKKLKNELLLSNNNSSEESNLNYNNISTESGNNVILSGSNGNTIQIIADRLSESTSLITNSDDAGFTFSKISPEYIKSEIERASLYQQEAVSKSFIDIYVNWELRLFTISNNSEKEFRVSFVPKESLFPDIRIIIDIGNYPVFKIAKLYSLFIIEGKIIECAKMDIKLNVKSIKAIE